MISQKQPQSDRLLFGLLIVMLIFTVLLGARYFLGLNVLHTSEKYIEQLRQAYGEKADDNLDQPVISASDPALGAKDAPNIIVLFSDFQCPACSDMAGVLKQLMDKRPGKILLVWKDVPNRLHPEAENAAIAARCAAKQGMFWQYHDLLFESQTGLNVSLYKDLAKKIGLDEQLFNNCYDNKAVLSEINASVSLASSLLVDATPYLFVNGESISGAIGLDDLEKLIK